MVRSLLLIPSIIFLLFSVSIAQIDTSTESSDYYVIVKLANPQSFDIIANQAKGREVKRALEYLETDPNFRGKPHPLNNYFKIKVASKEERDALIAKLNKTKGVEYAEPQPQHKLLFIPNDPDAAPAMAQGMYLDVIKAFEAWDINKGDPNLIIAIVDSGTDLDHPDLVGNLYLNLGDPVNSIDDDGDGLIDNYQGWDFADNDNDPTADGDTHGTEVAGQAAASTNNGIGIAGVGFDSKYMPLKAFRSSDDSFFGGFEAIAYAADKGCKVINLSWGNFEDGYFQHEQDFINYAALEKDAVIVAAAGNTDAHLDFYPASYDNVLSVGATKLDDRKTSFSTYSHKIDVMAPGEGIFTTVNDDSYVSNKSGTSYSSPLTAGAVALVRSQYPELNALQVIEKIRITSDDIYGVSGNSAFEGKLGKGRLNVFRALSEDVSPAVRFRDVVFKEQPGEPIFFKDTLRIRGNFINYLEPSPNIRATISTESTYLTILNDEFIVGNLGKLDSADNQDNPFVVVVDENTPPGSSIAIRIDYVDGIYQDFEYIEFETAKDFVTLKSDDLSFTVAGNGNLGFPDYAENEGVGFLENTTTIFSFAGLAISENSGTVADNVVSNFSIPTRELDFETDEFIRLHNNSTAAVDARSVFTNNPELDLRIEARTLAWDQKHFVVEYRIINQSAGAYTNFNTALFTDWDLNNYQQNKTGWDGSNNLGYVYSNDLTSYAGVSLLSAQNPSFYALDLANFNGNTPDIDNTFSKAEKHDFISQGVDKINAGAVGIGNDVAIFNGVNVASLGVNQVETVVFAYLVGNSLSEIQSERLNALNNYNGYLASPPIEYLTFICTGEQAVLDPEGTYEFYSDAAGMNLIGSGDSYTTPPLTSTATYYAKRTDLPYEGRIIGLQAVVKEITADFSTSPEEILISPGEHVSVIFVDESNDAVSWSWDFDNGFISTQKNPQTIYDTEGDYSVDLTVTNLAGCTDMIAKIVQVRETGIRPDVEEDMLICGGNTVTIQASNTNLINVYLDEELEDLIFSGDVFESGPLEASINYYVTNAEGTFESFPVEVVVTVDPLIANFSWAPDTETTGSSYDIKLTSTSSSWKNNLEWKIDGTSLGSNEIVSFNYTGLTSFSVELTVSDSVSCTRTKSETITPSQSESPIIADPVVKTCYDSDYTVTPSNGTYFRFYNDSGLQELIGKGKTLELKNITESKKIYITSIDELLDSEPVEMSINLSALSADFLISPSDSLNLPDDTTATFTSLSEEAVQWIWTIGGVPYNTQEVEVPFDEQGTVEISLFVVDDINCNDRSQGTYLITDIPTSLEDQISEMTWNLYPVPSKGSLYIEGPDFNKVEIRDTNGRLLRSVDSGIQRETMNLDLISLGTGIYLIKVSSDEQNQIFRIIIE